MTSYVMTQRGPNVFFFRKKEPTHNGRSKDAIVERERSATLKKIDDASKDRTSKLLEEFLRSDTVTLRIFVGRGGARRG